ncbi:MAG TPA: luciferase family protein [Gemmatimonadales bacterium]|nr:luciferase family protein [Gemmatimonadales bacterium]
MPHAQLDVVPDPAVERELYRRAYAMPGIENRPSLISVPGARALWLADDVEIARPEVILRGREFAHIHPDASLHVTLPPERAVEAIAAGWAEQHPIAQQAGIPGLVMVFTPRSPEELDVVLQLIRESYEYVTRRAEGESA